MNTKDNEDKNIILKETEYQKIKGLLNKKDDYFTKSELEFIYKKIDVILT